MHFGNIESVEIDSDERGLVLRIQSEEFGEIALDMTFEVAEALYNRCRADIGPWLRERDVARGTSPLQRAYGGKVVSIFACDPDESAGAYELSDPAHPRYHSVHADLWDMREGK